MEEEVHEEEGRQMYTMGAIDTQHTHNQNLDTDEKEPFVRRTESICPTCQGKGKLSQSQAENVVALIPAGDKRLKPRRTKLYLTITTILMAVVIGLVAFLLWRLVVP